MVHRPAFQHLRDYRSQSHHLRRSSGDVFTINSNADFEQKGGMHTIPVGGVLDAGTDTYNLQRFINAQESTFDLAKEELAAGQKCSHWMWFIFPQIKGLGSSPTSQRFAISNIKEGAAYLEHPLLGRRLEECTSLVNSIRDRSVGDVFGYPDDLKFHSSMTLFARVADEFQFETLVFKKALAKYFSNRLDEGTLDRLRSMEGRFHFE